MGRHLHVAVCTTWRTTLTAYDFGLVGVRLRGQALVLSPG